MSRVLVTGASGFVGTHLLEALVEQAFDVYAVSRREKFSAPIITINITADDVTDWHSVLEGKDVVVHLAAKVHQFGQQSEQDYIRDNVDMTMNLAKQAAASGVKQFIFLSTIKVNGEVSDHQGFSQDSAAQPQDAYARSKWMAEQQLMELHRQSEMKITILRPPLVYGPRVKANFRSLLKMANVAFPLPFAAVHCQRTMVYVGNLISAIMKCIEHPDVAAGQTFLVADNESLSLEQLLAQMRELMGKPKRLFSVPVSGLCLLTRLLGRGSLNNKLFADLKVNNSYIKKTLGWEPPHSCQRGLATTITWYQQL